MTSFHCHYPQYGNSIAVISRYEGPGDHGEIAGRATAAQARPAARRNARTIFGAVCETLGAFAALRSRLLLGFARFHDANQSMRCLARRLHHYLSAHEGLAAGVYGQHTGRRKQGNVRHSHGEIQNEQR